MASKNTLNKVETAIDTTSETVETLERIPKLALNGTTRKQQAIILGTVAGVGMISGIVLTVAAHRGKLKLVRKKNRRVIENFAEGKDV